MESANIANLDLSATIQKNKLQEEKMEAMLLLGMVLIAPWIGFGLFFSKTSLGKKIVDVIQQQDLDVIQQQDIIFALSVLSIILTLVYLPAKLWLTNVAWAFIVNFILSIPCRQCEQEQTMPQK